MHWKLKRYVAKTVVFFLGSVLAVGCGTDFDPGSLILDLRVLAVETTIDEDTLRANPNPGETVNVRVGAFGPTPNEAMTWAATACLSLGAPFGGIAPCEGAFLANEAQLEATTALPAFDFGIPIDAAERATQVQVLGLVCPVGVPDLTVLADPQAGFGDAPCTDPEDPGEPFVLTVPLEDDATLNTPNVRPFFATGAFAVDGAPWPAEAGFDSACNEESRLRFSRQQVGTVDITISGFTPEDRETFSFFSDEPRELVTDRERLLISHFTTAGELERQFSSLEDDDELEQTVEWDLPPPEEIPTAGRPVRFVFVVRDGRGGTSWTERNLCVVP